MLTNYGTERNRGDDLIIFAAMASRPRVCHITTVHPAYDVRIFHKQCSTLARAGYDVTLLVANGPTETRHGVKVVGVEVQYSSRLGRIRKTSKALLEKALTIDADVYHFHDPEFLKSARKLQMAGKKVIYDVHEDVPRQILAKAWIPKLVRGSVSARFEKMENKISAELSYICTATPFIRDRFLKVNPNSVDVNNYPILSEWDGMEADAAARKGACYVGGITVVRGIKELVMAMDGADFHLQLAGKWETEALHGEVKAMPGWSQVDEKGFLDRQEVAEVYRQTAVGLVVLHPIDNYIEALPVKLFEYMAAGLPVVASAFPRWQAIVDDAQCGLCVDPMNPTAIREAVQTLLNDPEGRKAMGKAGRAAVEEKYNWAQEGQKLLAVYAQLTNGEPADA